jgi:hypothetical protein
MIDSASTAADERLFRRAHNDLLGQSGYQFSLPAFQRPKVPEWLLAVQEFLQHNWIFVKWSIWLIAAIILCFALYTWVRAYWPVLLRQQSKSDRLPQITMTDWRPTPARARQLLEEADGLAARGLYSDAVHSLLLRSIEDIEEWRPRLVQPMLTSREIAMLGGLPEITRAAFGRIARVVEHALFAGECIDAAQFAHCRKDYETFAFAPTWQIGAAR